jgi:importin subunit alpha-1
MDAIQKDLYATNLEVVEQAIKKLKEVSKDSKIFVLVPENRIEEIINAKFIPRIIELAKQTQDPVVQVLIILSNVQKVSSTRLLSNISGCITDSHIQAFVDEGLIPFFTECLSNEYEEAQELGVLALGNIADCSLTMRNHLLSLGLMSKFVKIISSQPSLSMMRLSMWAIANLCLGVVSVINETKSLLSALKELMPKIEDEDVLVNCCLAIDSLSIGDGNIPLVIESGIYECVVKCLSSSSDEVISTAIGCLGNISTGNDLQTQVVIDCGL